MKFTPEKIDFALEWLKKRKKKNLVLFPVDEGSTFHYHHGLARMDFDMMQRVENRTLERPK